MAGKTGAVAGLKRGSEVARAGGPPSHPILLRRRFGQTQEGMKQEGRGWARFGTETIDGVVVQRGGIFLKMYLVIVDKESERISEVD